jgi:hypothetical protein
MVLKPIAARWVAPADFFVIKNIVNTFVNTLFL